MYALYRIGDEPLCETIARTAPQGHSKQYLDLAHQSYKSEPLPALDPEEEAALRRWALFGSRSLKGRPLPDCMREAR